MNVSEAILHELVELGVEACFGNPGTSEMHLVASFDRVGGLRPILGLFEGVCTGAADGYARMAGKPAATLLHLGPGLGNGFANLHNARRGQSRVINLVGDHATYHRKYDAPLQTDIHSIAKPVSDWIGDPVSGEDALTKTREAFDVAMRPNGGLSTLIVPADIAWSEMKGGAARASSKKASAKPVDMKLVREAAEALKSGEPKMLLIGGHAGLEKPLKIAAAIAEKTGARLFADTFVPRLARGRGRARPERVPYLGEMAVMMMKDFRHAVMVGAKAPVAFLAYPNKPSTFLSPECKTYAPWTMENDVVDVLTALAEEVGAKIGGGADGAAPAEPGAGKLTVESFGNAVAALLPEGAVVSDEAITAGLWAQMATQTSAPHDWLALTGGAIGDGIPMAVGAAVACPGRPVINLQADGSAMYTVQGLWTAARENLHVITILLNNKSYAILNMELDRVGATAQSERSRSLLSLDKPVIDFTSLGRALGVSAVRAEDNETFVKALKRALAEPGPHLIEAMMA